MIAAALFLLLVGEPDLSGVLSLMGRESMAHACPISATQALTNVHVVQDAPYIWEAAGHYGLLGAEATTIRDRFRDLAVVEAWHTQFPRWYVVSQTPPQVGDYVYFLGFDFTKKDKAFAPRAFKARILRIRNAHLILTPPGVPGTSGSCVLNEQGEVVAINQGGKELDDKTVVGVAVGVWAPLLGLGK